MSGQRRGKCLEILSQVLLGEPVDGVAHGVGGHHGRVVSLGVGPFDISGEEDLGGHIRKAVEVVSAMDLGDSDF